MAYGFSGIFVDCTSTKTTEKCNSLGILLSV